MSTNYYACKRQWFMFFYVLQWFSATFFYKDTNINVSNGLFLFVCGLLLAKKNKPI